MDTTQSNHFCAAIYIERQSSGKYQIVGVTADRFPKEVKLPGGTNKNSPWENKEQTLVREFTEETGLVPTDFRLALSLPDRGHTKYFFVCLRVEGRFDGPKTIKEPDGDELTVRFWDLGAFEQRLFRNHRPAFLMVCAVLAKADQNFAKNYPHIFRQLDGI